MRFSNFLSTKYDLIKLQNRLIAIEISFDKFNEVQDEIEHEGHEEFESIYLK